jgi:Helix-turn-helix domain
MKSPGAPSHRREVEREFWREIATGLLPEEAARAVGVSQAVGGRWFRHGGGMPSVDLAPLSGRYLSFREREEIAILKVQGAGVRQIARELRRAPSTISRELRRNAATRGVAGSTIGPRSRNGRPISWRGVRRRPSWS